MEDRVVANLGLDRDGQADHPAEDRLLDPPQEVDIGQDQGHQGVQRYEGGQVI